MASAIAVPVDAEPADDYELNVWHVTGTDQDAIDVFLASGYDLVEGRYGDAYLVVADEILAEEIRALGLTVTLPAEAAFALRSAPAVSALDDPGSFRDGYRTTAEVASYVRALPTEYPDLVRVVKYGESWRKLNTPTAGANLLAVCITKQEQGDCDRSASHNDAKPRSLVVAAVHARELATVEVATRLIDTLVEGYGSDADVTHILDTTEVWVVPVANPDGRAIVQTGDERIWHRKNANDVDADCNYPAIERRYGGPGVDLNRNASTEQWGQYGVSFDPCSLVFPGPSAGSEPEVQALEQLTRELFPDNRDPGLRTQAPASTAGIFMSLHSYSDLILLPPGAPDQRTPNDLGMRALAFRMGHFNQYVIGTVPEVLYPVAGSNDEYVYFELGVPSFTYEIGPVTGRCGGFHPPYDCIDSDLWPVNRGALLYGLSVAAAPYRLAHGPITHSVSVSRDPADPTSATVTAIADDDTFSNAPGSFGRPEAQEVQRVEYYLDTPPVPGRQSTGMNMDPVGQQQFNTPRVVATASIDTSELSTGTHTVYVRARTLKGRWGPVSVATFDID